MGRRRRASIGIVATAAVVATLLLPGLAQACAVCGVGQNDNRLEFILTTALLSFLPMALIGGIVWQLRKRYLSLGDQPPREAPEISPAKQPLR